MSHPPGPVVRHVLLDADGVLQRVPTDWRERLAVWFGDDVDAVIEEAWTAEAPSLVGEGDFLAELAALLDRRGNPTTAAELHAAIWTSIEQFDDALAVIGRLRAAGYGIHLGTNQAPDRAAHMRTELGYDDLFDVSVYSCDLGVAKPDPAYFVRAAALVGVDPAEILFVDDRAANVEGAREAGMAAEQWTHPDGVPALEALLAGHGVRL